MSFLEEDKIGRGEIVDKICGLVDSLEDNKNFCLSLNGAWGSGKSFVLSMIEEKLSVNSEYIIIKYDAWENSFYSDPLIAILSCVIDGLKNKLSKLRGYKKVVKEIGKQHGKEIIDKLCESSGKLGFMAKLIKEFTEILPSLKNVSLTTDTKDAQLEIFKSYKSLLQDVKDLLNTLTGKTFVENKQTKLVILVDEIDRCLPDEQLKILERLHHLFDVKNCAVIVALNQLCVAKTVRTIYGIDGNEYLRKFFDFTFKLETSSSEYLKNLFNGFSDSFDKLKIETKEIDKSINLAYYCLLDGSEKALEKVDNRELNRYFDGIINVCNAFGLQKLKKEYLFFIVLALYIRKIISPTFLDKGEIIKNQNVINESLEDDYDTNKMPYYDYLNDFLGINRKKTPGEFFQLDSYYRNNIAEFSWCFNEIVARSVEGIFIYNERYYYPRLRIVNPDDCTELCRLVVLYGGEQQKSEN